MCTVIGSHRDHACVGIREAERELRVRNRGVVTKHAYQKKYLITSQLYEP